MGLEQPHEEQGAAINVASHVEESPSSEQNESTTESSPYHYELKHHTKTGAEMFMAMPNEKSGLSSKEYSSMLARLIQASTQPGAWILDPFNGSGTTGIAANLLERKYLGLEMEDEFLSMSKARREEIENSAVRSDYLERLAKAKIILHPDNFFIADDSDVNYGIPWL